MLAAPRHTTVGWLAVCTVQLLLLAVVQGQQFSSQRFNIKGEVLILDVASLDFNSSQAESDMPPLTQQTCAQACARVPGCTAWTYCNNENGCGGSCKSHVAKNPGFSALQPADVTDPDAPMPAWTSLDRITAFGPWGPTAECKGDAWPHGVCTLKKLADPTTPEFWSLNTTEGWVSGFTQIPPECANVSARTCGRCLNSTDPAACLTCASDPAVNMTIVEAALANGTTKSDGCASCFEGDRTPANSTICVACLTDATGCVESCHNGICGAEDDGETTVTIIESRRIEEHSRTTVIVTRPGANPAAPPSHVEAGLGRRMLQQ